MYVCVVFLHPDSAPSCHRALSALAHWSSIFGETEYLPGLVFPFVKLFQNNQLITFEILATILSKYVLDSTSNSTICVYRLSSCICVISVVLSIPISLWDIGPMFIHCCFTLMCDWVEPIVVMWTLATYMHPIPVCAFPT